MNTWKTRKFRQTISPICGSVPGWQYQDGFAKYQWRPLNDNVITVYPKKYAHGFVVLCFVVVMQSFIMNSREVFIHIHQGCFAGTGAIVRLPQCQWSKSDGYGKISQCITTTKHSKAKTVCIFLGIYCTQSIYRSVIIRDGRFILFVWKVAKWYVRVNFTCYNYFYTNHLITRVENMCCRVSSISIIHIMEEL